MVDETIDDAKLTLAHYRRIAALSERLASRGRCAIYRHQYDYLTFGSWQLVAGSRRRRFRFTWDGRDRFLDVEVGTAQGGNAVSWSRNGLPNVDLSDDPLESVQAIIEAEM
jgi:hypothetical protein